MTDEPDNQPDGGEGDADGASDGGDSLFDQSIRGLLWSAVDRGGTAVVGVLVDIALARLLVPRHFGLVAMARIGIEFINLLKDQGFEDAIIQRPDLEDSHLDTALWTLVVVGFVLAAGGILAAPYFAGFFEEPALEPVFMALLLNVPVVSATSVPSAILKRDMRFKVLSLRSLFAVVIGGVVGIGMALFGFGVWALVGKQIASTLVGAVVLWAAIDWTPSLSYSYDRFKELFSFGANITAERLMNFVNRQLDDILIGRVLGSTALGYYSIAYEILKGLTNLLSRTVADVAYPAFSRLQENRDELREAYYAALKTVSYVAFPIFSLYIAVAPELITAVYGPKWAPAIPVVQVLGGIGILHSVNLLNGPIVKSCGKPSWEFGLSGLNVVLNAIGFAIAVQYGIVAVAAAYVIRGYVVLPPTLWLIRKLIDLKIGNYLRTLAFPLTGCALLVVAVFGTRFALGETLVTAARLIILILAGALVYLAYLQAFLPQSARDFIERMLGVLESDSNGDES